MILIEIVTRGLKGRKGLKGLAELYMARELDMSAHPDSGRTLDEFESADVVSIVLRTGCPDYVIVKDGNCGVGVVKQ